MRYKSRRDRCRYYRNNPPVAISRVIHNRQTPNLLSIFTACPTKTEVEPPLQPTRRPIPLHKIQNSVEIASAVVVSLQLSVAKYPTDRYQPTIKTYLTSDVNDNGNQNKSVVLCLIMICSFNTKVGTFWQERTNDGKI